MSQYLLFWVKFQNIVVCPATLWILSMQYIANESRIIPALGFRYSTWKRRVPSRFGSNIIGDAHSIWTGSIKSMASIFSLSRFYNSLPLRLVQRGTENKGRSFFLYSSIRCCTFIIEGRWLSHMFSNFACISTNLCQNATYSNSICSSSRQFKFAFPCNSFTSFYLSNCSYRHSRRL